MPPLRAGALERRGATPSQVRRSGMAVAVGRGWVGIVGEDERVRGRVRGSGGVVMELVCGESRHSFARYRTAQSLLLMVGQRDKTAWRR